jgi:DNA polymerase III alpha subunit
MTSFLDGFIDIEKYVAFCKEQQFPGCAITDHGSMSSVIEFYQQCEKHKINPIIGCEMYITQKDDRDEPIRDNFHINIFAKNEQGYKELCTIFTESNINRYYYRPRTHISVLKKYAKNLICSSACMSGEIQQCLLKHPNEKGLAIAKLREYMDVFGDDFYIELVLADLNAQRDANKLLMGLIKDYNLKFIITTDAHYLRPEDEICQDVLLKIQREGFTFSSKTHWVATFDELKKLVKEQHPYINDEFFNKAIEYTHEINKKVHIDFSEWIGKINMPDFKNELNMDNLKFFEKLTAEGFDKFLDKYEKYVGPMSEELEERYRKRVKYEYEVLAKSGSFLYILLVRDIIQKAHKLKTIIKPNQLKVGDYFYKNEIKYAVISIDSEFIVLNFFNNQIEKITLDINEKIELSKEIMTGMGRGSAAGSLICYLLDITQIDPIRRDLLFERFVNPTRLFGGFQPELSCLSYAMYKLYHYKEEHDKWNLENILKKHNIEIDDRLRIEIDFFQKYNAEPYICYVASKEEYRETKNIFNSWLLYHLGITDEEPKEDFKAKYSPPTFPDIDVDFSDKGRAVDMMVENYVSNNNDHITKRRAYPVAAFGQLKCKGAIKDVAKAIESIIIDYSKTWEEHEKNNKKKYTDETEDGLNVARDKWEKAKENYIKEGIFDPKMLKYLSFENVNKATREMPANVTFDDLKADKNLKLYKEIPKVMEIAERLEYTKKYLGTHASAVCIIPEYMVDCVPIARTGDDFIIAMNDVQACGGDYSNNLGLVKNDILGLTSLLFLQEAQEMAATHFEVIAESGKRYCFDYNAKFELIDGTIKHIIELQEGDDIVGIISDDANYIK